MTTDGKNTETESYRRPRVTRHIVTIAAELSRHHTIADVAAITDLSPYVITIIARYRDKPCPKPALSREQRDAIAKAPTKVTNQSLAQRYGVSPQYIRRLRRRHPRGGGE